MGFAKMRILANSLPSVHTGVNYVESNPLRAGTVADHPE